jgi:hypothetical protein
MTRELTVDEFIARDLNAYRKAGCRLAEAAMFVIREYDGLHRLSLAVAEWAKTVGDEGGRALPVTDEREGRHKVGNPVCPKCFASHPPLLDCTLQFVANAAPVEGDEAWHDAANEFLDQALNGKDPVAAVKAIVAKAPKN